MEIGGGFPERIGVALTYTSVVSVASVGGVGALEQSY